MTIVTGEWSSWLQSKCSNFRWGQVQRVVGRERRRGVAARGRRQGGGGREGRRDVGCGAGARDGGGNASVPGRDLPVMTGKLPVVTGKLPEIDGTLQLWPPFRGRKRGEKRYLPAMTGKTCQS